MQTSIRIAFLTLAAALFTPVMAEAQPSVTCAPTEAITSIAVDGTVVCSALPVGVVGPTGATGATGDAGSVGDTGSPGNAGAQGATGSVGATGAVGDVGAAGVAGAAGATGATGSVGVTGPTGPTGATGPSGPAFSTYQIIRTTATGTGNTTIWAHPALAVSVRYNANTRVISWTNAQPNQQFWNACIIGYNSAGTRRLVCDDKAVDGSGGGTLSLDLDGNTTDNYLGVRVSAHDENISRVGGFLLEVTIYRNGGTSYINGNVVYYGP